MKNWSGKSVLVAGGAGFIGRHLVTTLLEAGATVHVVDNYATGEEASMKALCARFVSHLTTQTDDISENHVLPPTDVIFNLASPASPRHYQADPIGTWKSNVLGAFHLLDHAQNCGASFVQASTSEVYGDPLHHPQVETDWGNVNPVGPRACYDESKRAAETLLMDAWRTGQSDIRIARIFNTYGTGMTAGDGRAIPNFMSQAKAGQPLTIYGDGSQTRSLCYVSDTVDALMRMGLMDAAKGEVINVGNPVEMTILQIAETVNAHFGSRSKIVFEPRPVDDPTRRCPDIGKAKRLLGWSPIVSFAEGLTRMAEDVRQPTEVERVVLP
ncbi:NAD-dependent epimerase/dehydratase family protein [Cognatiyoonia sp. IB215182]|uniref:NAD-dependent epimerase/dehydratase family protein n=1 Tax=Cognatiyoonia sp. IB215182 TaxID=3097353 RepID=UPI002A0D4EB1|nr:NAD-dependent epimerase/dehydratase family protein [Cognatiyoonia sp. IB215182]MDX8353050.1 GDP-mannose 4,6-dehydratase [Cognatiyoonia sp. IB215182]